MRTVLIRIEGANRRVLKLQLRDGSRVSDILRHLKVPEDYILVRASNPTHHLPREAEVHALIATDGEHLIARSRSAPVENADGFRLTIAH